MNNNRESTNSNNPPVRFGDLVLSPASESKGRAALLPTKPSEDARHVLGTIQIEKTNLPTEGKDYLPESAVSWVLDIRFEDAPELDPRKVDAEFDKEWRKSFGGFTSYGRDIDTGKWTFLVSSNGPKRVDQIKFAFDYVDVLDDMATIPSRQQYEERIQQVQKRVARFGRANISPSLSPEMASKRSEKLRGLKRTADLNIVLVLKAPPGRQFEGRKVWDAMLCLGLEWGDMDCFHWKNESEVGGDFFFSVETTTEPGYFLPEEVAADRVSVDDLVFVFSVPRSADPIKVFDAMTRAVEYCKGRMGGTIMDSQGTKADIGVMRKQIERILETLRIEGFKPGASATLQLF